LLAGESLILAGNLFVGHTGRIHVSFRCHPLAYCRQQTSYCKSQAKSIERVVGNEPLAFST
jgi:hypothetical protein